MFFEMSCLKLGCGRFKEEEEKKEIKIYSADGIMPAIFSALTYRGIFIYAQLPK